MLGGTLHKIIFGGNINEDSIFLNIWPDNQSGCTLQGLLWKAEESNETKDAEEKSNEAKDAESVNTIDAGFPFSICNHFIDLYEIPGQRVQDKYNS